MIEAFEEEGKVVDRCIHPRLRFAPAALLCLSPNGTLLERLLNRVVL